MSYSTTASAGQTSQPFSVGVGTLITITPSPTGTGYVQYSNSSDVDIQFGNATWSTWPNGSVSAVSSDTTGDTMYIRLVCTAGSLSLSAGDGALTNFVENSATPWKSTAGFNSVSVAITGGAINGTPIGATTPSTGVFTTVTMTGLTTSTPNTQTGATYTVLASDLSVIANIAGTQTATLGAATAGRVLIYRTITANTVVSASANVVPLAGGAAGTAILAATAGKWAILHGDGTNWQIMAAN